jgi:hypothetical protein
MIVSDISLIEQDSIDIHKTTQLAYVLFILSQKLQKDNILKSDFADARLLPDMLKATSSLIKATSATDEQEAFNVIATETMGFDKSTVPLNL